MVIRPAVARDGAAIYELLCQLEDARFDHEAFDARFAWQLESAAFCGFVLVDDGEIAGFINVRVERQLHHERPVAEICELVVDAGSRGSGRGMRLFEEAVAYARACGCEGIEVTSNDRRARAHRFYEARGMERTHVKLTMGL